MTLAQDCAAGLAAVQDRDFALRAERLLAPQVGLWAGNLGDINLMFQVRSENEYKWIDNENDTGEGSIEIDATQPEAQWLWDIKGRKDRGETIDVLVTVEYVGRRWSGFLDSVKMHTDDLGISKVTASFLSDYEQVKARDLWATPVTPAGFQPFKIFMMGGPTHWALGTALKLNLARAHGWGGMGFFDPLADGAGDYQSWPIVLKPLSYAQAASDNVTTGLVLSRFKTFHEVAEPMLNDADMTLRWRRYMPGDPLPWPGAKVSYGTLVIWFEDNASELAPLVTGSIFDGIAQLAKIFVSALLEGIGAGSVPIENSEQSITGLPPVPEYQVPGYIGTDPRKPYVLYPANSPGVVSQEATIKLARYHRLTGGGHSMPGVNELISAAVQAIGDAAASLYSPLPPLGGVADALLKPFYEDTVLAFMTVYLVNRSQYLSDLSLYEMWVEGADNAYTLSATMVLREAVRATESKYSSSMEIIDGAPWFVGAPGHGHFDLGNRILVQTRGDESGRIDAPRVKSLTLSGARGSMPKFEIQLGTKEPEDAFGKALKRIQELAGGLKALGVL